MTLAQGLLSVLLLGTLTVLTNGYTKISFDAYFYLILSGILGISLSGTFFFSALKEMSPHAIALLFMLGQVITVLLAIFLLGESLPMLGWVGIALIITGVTIGISPGNLEKTASTPRGITFGLISILLMSFALILTKKGLAGEISTLYATFIRMLAGTFGVLCAGLATRRLGGWLAPFRDISLIYKFTTSVCIVTFGGFWLAIVSYKYTNLAVASSLLSTEPILILLASALFLNNKLTLKSVLGVCFATAGVIAISWESFGRHMR
jgi:drug/metabolite transporter (DMT)-like permease